MYIRTYTRGEFSLNWEIQGVKSLKAEKVFGQYYIRMWYVGFFVFNAVECFVSVQTFPDGMRVVISFTHISVLSFVKLSVWMCQPL